MKISHDGNTISIKNVRYEKDHEGWCYIAEADVVLNDTKVGYYAEDYMNGSADFDINEQYQYIFEEISDLYFTKYPQGILAGKYSFSIKDLWKDNMIEGILAEMATMDSVEKNVNQFLKKYKFCVIAKKEKNSLERTYGFNTIKKKKELTQNNIIIFEAERGKNNFEVSV